MCEEWDKNEYAQCTIKFSDVSDCHFFGIYMVISHLDYYRCIFPVKESGQRNFNFCLYSPLPNTKAFRIFSVWHTN